MRMQPQDIVPVGFAPASDLGSRTRHRTQWLGSLAGASVSGALRLGLEPLCLASRGIDGQNTSSGWR